MDKRHWLRLILTGMFILLGGLPSIPRLFAEEWTEFRGPTGQGVTSQTGLPVHWSPTENVDWKVDIPGKGWSSPIILQGRIYLTTAVPTDSENRRSQSLRTLCLDAKTGKILWNVEVFKQDGDQPGTKIHSKNSHASPTPITDGKRLYVHFGTHGTACLDLDGKIVWTNRKLKYSPVHGNGGSPVLVAGVLVINCDGGDKAFVVALDQQTGDIRWQNERTTTPKKKFSFGTPLVIEVDGHQQVLCPGSNILSAFDPADGHEIWHVLYEGYSVVPRPVFGQGLVFLCTGYDSPSLLAIRPDGQGDVTDTHIAWRLKKGVPLNPSPMLVDNRLYMVSDNGVASCIDAPTGKVQWQKRLGGNFSASPVLAEGRIYFQNEAGEGIVIESGPKYVELSRNDLGERTLASYGVVGDAFIIRTEHRLYRVAQQ